VKSANPSVFGFNLDPGICTVCADSQWAGYTGPVSPALANPPIPVAYVRNVGWDVSHARRFAHYILALEDLAARISLPEYDAKSGAELANQIFYAVFNGDYQQPLFSNFIDGSKGWYRVGYGGPADPGYAPGTLSSSVPFGGYFFLSHDNPKLNTLMRGMADFAMISNSAFRDQYYGPLAPVASYSFGAFQFFPSLIGLQAFPCAFKAIAPNYCSLLP
jgi:hypothetical protein